MVGGFGIELELARAMRLRVGGQRCWGTVLYFSVFFSHWPSVIMRREGIGRSVVEDEYHAQVPYVPLILARSQAYRYCVRGQLVRNGSIKYHPFLNHIL